MILVKKIIIIILSVTFAFTVSSTSLAIEKKDQQKTFANLKVGNKVVVRHAKVDRKNVAKHINVQIAKPESEKKQI